MTELERLRADLATIQKAAQIAKEAGFHRRTGTYDMVEEDLKQKIADLEAQQATEDKWKQARAVLFAWEIKNKVLNYEEKQLVLAYVRELQHQVAELDDELRCERIADLEAQQAPDEVGKWKTAKDNVSVWLAFPQFEATGMQRVAYYVKHLEAKVAELDHELRCERIDGGKVRDDQKAVSAEKNREKLAELVTIQNAIPPACGLARELVQKRIEGVKREMQGNG